MAYGKVRSLDYNFFYFLKLKESSEKAEKKGKKAFELMALNSMMFEMFTTPTLYIQIQAVLSLYLSGGIKIWNST